jgi:hypothetical protein
MRVKAISLVLAVCFAIAALGVAGCGSSSKKHHTVRNAAIAAGVALAIHHHEKVKHQKQAAAAAGYKAGESCSKSNESAYKAAGYKCKKEHGKYQLVKA